jgi:hypothetical protein
LPITIFCRMINQANRHPGHAAWLSAIRSKPFAPNIQFSKSKLWLKHSLPL